MKSKKTNPKNSKNKKISSKRCIHARGEWKSIELDPSLFSEEGLEGLVCFEELTNYKLVDTEKAAAEAERELRKRKEGWKEKKKTKKKRKASEEEEEVGGEEEEEETTTAEPAKKKKKKKKEDKSGKEDGAEDETSKEASGEHTKKNKKVIVKESEQPDESVEEKKDERAAGEPDVQPEKKKKKRKRNRKKKNKQQVEDEKTPKPETSDPQEEGKDETPDQDSPSDPQDVETLKTPDQDSPSDPQEVQNLKTPDQDSPSDLQDVETLKTPDQDSPLDPEEEEKPSETPKPQKAKKQIKNWTSNSGCEDQKADVSGWKDLFVPPPVLRALSSLGFGSPSPIQALTLPPAIRDRMDILGAAETGSGKTLAFGIPMISAILEWQSGEEKPEDRDPAGGTPQVESIYLPSLKEEEEEEEEEEDEEVNSEDDDEDDQKLGCVRVIEDAEFDFESEEAGGETGSGTGSGAGSGVRPLLGLVLTPTRELAVQVKHHIDAVAKFTEIRTVVVVGGMAPEKQRKLLRRRPEIVIATPGRLWDLIQERHPHLSNLRQLRCLVIDEADRMVERGHFAELENLLEMLNTVHFNPRRQNFVFSATLTMTRTLPARLLQKKKKKHLDQRSQLEILVDKVGIRSKPKVIDLTRKEATVETLTETRIHCQKEDKDFYLYYFLLQYPGRTMVFANSIDVIKRLNSLLGILGLTPLPLHANMHQKARLKNLERFAERESCILLTTDVAARGLDIPNVQHVIHYQVPRTSETYVHRSGRTARAAKEGLSLLMIGPDDMMNFKKIYKSLGKDEDLPMFPVELRCMAAIKERVNVARRIEKIEFFNSREKQHNSWVRQAAEALDVDVDDELLIGRGRDEGEDRQQQKAVKGMKKHLKHLVSQPVFKNVMRTRYPTQMGKLSLPRMPLAGGEDALTRVSMQDKKRNLKKGGAKKKPKKTQQQQQ